jgi:hypothetical protein
VEVGRLSGHGSWTLRQGDRTVTTGEGGSGVVVVDCPAETTTFTLTLDRTDNG